MQAVIDIIPTSIPNFQPKPFLVSFDSGDECSLEHWFEVIRLVEEEETVIVEIDDDDADWT